MICTIIGDADGITLGIGVVTYPGSSDGSLYCYNDGKLEGFFLGGSLGSTDEEVLGYDEGVKVGLFYGEVIGNILGNVDGITLRLDVGTELVSSDRSFDGYNII